MDDRKRTKSEVETRNGNGRIDKSKCKKHHRCSVYSRMPIYTYIRIDVYTCCAILVLKYKKITYIQSTSYSDSQTSTIFPMKKHQHYYRLIFLFLLDFSMCIPIRKQRCRNAISSSSGFLPQPPLGAEPPPALCEISVALSR